MKTPFRPLALCIPLSLLACSSPSTDDGAQSGEDALFAGFPATSRAFDAVGNIAEVLVSTDTRTALDSKCTGVLIGRHTVLTAAHCAQKYPGRDSFPYTEHRFRLGADSAHPTHDVRVVGRVLGPQLAGGIAGFGSDVAVFQLADDITDVTPMPIGAPLSSTEVGKPFVVVGYGQQSTGDGVGLFRARRLGVESLVALAGHPLRALFPDANALWQYAKTFQPGASLADYTALYNDPSGAIVAGQQAFFSGLRVHGSQTCSGDSGGPVLRRTRTGFEIVGVVSAGYQAGSFCWGGTYAGLPATAQNQAFLASSLADPRRGIADEGYCNATTAIRSTATADSPDPLESESPIHLVDCASLGQICGLEQGRAACVDAPTSAPASSCALAGAKFMHPRGAVFEFKPDGSYTVRGNALGTYTYANGLLSLHDAVGLCAGASDAYAVHFSANCDTLTLGVIQDQCQARAEGYDAYPFARQP